MMVGLDEVCSEYGSFSRRVERRDFFLAEAVGLLSGTPNQAKALTEEARVSLAFWSQWFNWRESLVIVKPETLIRWHRKGFKLYWRHKSRWEGQACGQISDG
jgi:putative transposase